MIVPLIGASVKGPAGIAMLPRLWLKAILLEAGLLPADYAPGYSGTNKILLDCLGVEPDATFAFLKTRPDYAAFEAWILAAATQADTPAIMAANATIVAQQKSAGNAEMVRSRVGLAGTAEAGAALMNALDDWVTVHENVIGRGERAPIVPALSPQSYGPLGLMHLPSLWLRALLSSTGTLASGWTSGSANALDVWFAGHIGIGIDTLVYRVSDQQPLYVPFERWVAERAGGFSPADVAETNAALFVANGAAVAQTDRADWAALHALAPA